MIVAAGSLLNKDVPDNVVVAGVPAKVIGNFEAFARKRMDENEWPTGLGIQNQRVSDALASFLWTKFDEQRGKGR